MRDSKSTTIPSHLKVQIEQTPAKTGVYKFLGKKGKVLYVGKAVNLRSRVRSYFTSDHIDRPYITHMIPLINQIKTIKTGNEIEALILESNLIKKYKPRFNQNLKDDKRYAWIHINTYKKFPKVKRTRETDLSGRYFGPYPDGRPIQRMLKYLRKLYPYADCKLEFYPDRDPSEVEKSRLCLYYHLGLCTGPCDNLVSPQEYKENIYGLIDTLQGKKKSQVKELEKDMKKLAEQKKFEKAAVVRDKIRDLKYLSQRIDVDFGDTEEDFRRIRQERFWAGLKESVSKLDLNIPDHKLKNMRVECYDISNIKGEIAYGSMTVAVGPEIKNSKYRIFKIKYPESTDDTSMLQEVLQRRLKYLSTTKENDEAGFDKGHFDNNNKNESLLEKPDIILLDGGKGQMSAAKDLMPDNIALMGISKGKRLKRAGKKQVDEFWKVATDDSIRKIKLKNPYIFQNLRDEAHRFAIKHHRKGRRFLQTKSVLDDIPGVGVKRKNALMRRFKTVTKIKEASVDEINEVVRNKKVAERVSEELSKE